MQGSCQVSLLDLRNVSLCLRSSLLFVLVKEKDCYLYMGSIPEGEYPLRSTNVDRAGNTSSCFNCVGTLHWLLLKLVSFH